VNDERSGNVISYAIILFSVLLLLVLHNPLTIYFMFFNSASPQWAHVITEIFMYVPAFNFAIFFGLISRIACNHFDGERLMIIYGRPVTYSDLLENSSGKFHTGDSYTIPSPIGLLLRMFYNICIYGLLIWY
jgi:hypothetical protein